MSEFSHLLPVLSVLSMHLLHENAADQSVVLLERVLVCYHKIGFGNVLDKSLGSVVV